MVKNPSNAKPEFAAFDTAAAADQIRSLAEQSIEQTGKAYSMLKDSGESVQKAVEQTLETTREAGSQWHLKALEAARTNTEAGFKHLEALAGVTSYSQFIELQTSFFRRQAETNADQLKELQSSASKATDEILKPFKDVFSRSLNNFNAA